MSKPLILGLSASLRNARSRASSHNLAAELEALASEEDLKAFIADQAAIHLDQFVKAGRAEGKPFDAIYRELQGLGGHRGLSNSEVCLVAALWSARDKGAAISHVALADHFPADGSEVAIPELKAKLREADGLLLASPVYFGDRSSLSQRFIEMIRADDTLRSDLKGRVYAGVAVGAKRNGGQETTLIYQMLDMINLGMLGVGNDSDTTSQYGGTAHAGDIGTIPKDQYGIDTSMGTGRRIGSVAQLLRIADDATLADKPKMGLWVLQDRHGELVRHLSPFLDDMEDDIAVQAVDVTGHSIRPCIACDICPTHVGPDEEYRCIIAKRDDGLRRLHDDILSPDILVPAMFSPKDRDGLISVYQQFMERTRYLRRGDYVYSDRLVAPLVFAEFGANEHLDIRMMTSFIRHHTIMHKPIVGWLHDGRLLNPEEVREGLASAALEGARTVRGRLGSASLGNRATQYNPVGYVLSSAKDKEVSTMSAREEATARRYKKLLAESRVRLEPVPTGKALASGT